ncbi:hydroxyacid dehydrogenase [Actinoallomurus sp. NPDC050550]|uniref:hydroxyacid dehydrogenase n=1 Tax=Actinoallomurus sp. NPDC050550 TaxID=3154937 RepID=UPI0033F9DFA1
MGSWSMADRPKALFAMRPRYLSQLFPVPLMSRLEKLVEIDTSLVAQRFDQPEIVQALADTEILITGWGAPRLDDAVLAAAPRLRAMVHAAGSVRHLVGDACWERGLLVSSAAQANAVPVAEYTVAAVLMAGKGVFEARERYRADPDYRRPEDDPAVGNYGRRVGLIGASRVGRRVLELLRPHDLTLTLADPYLDAAEAGRLGAELLPLDELLRTSTIISVHAPDIPQTRGLLDRRRLALIPDGSMLINTARGALVDHDALIAELVKGRISAVLDVTDPEPPPADSPLFQLSNVFLTPHIAGSMGNELERLGRSAVEELERLTAGRPLGHQVNKIDLDRVA